MRPLLLFNLLATYSWRAEGRSSILAGIGECPQGPETADYIRHL